MKKEVSLASLKDSVNETVAYLEECRKEGASMAELESVINYIDQRLRYMQQGMDSLWTQLYEHTSEGHLPKLVGAAQMQKAIKALGLDGDYEVQKRVIYASDSGEPTEAWFTLKKKEN